MLKTIMVKRPAFTFISLSTIIFVSALEQTVSDSGATGNAAASGHGMAGSPGFAELPDERGGINVEVIVYTEEMGFDKERSPASLP